MPAGFEDVAIACPVTVPYSRFSEREPAWFLGSALRLLLEASGLDKSAIDGLSAASFTLAPDTVVSLTEHFGIETRWLDWQPTGGASGLLAMRRAARAVQAGDARIIACIAGDTNAPGSFATTVEGFSRFSRAAVWPYGQAGPNLPFALITQHVCRRYGLELADLDRLVIASRKNAAANPNALLRDKPLDARTCREAPLIADPLRRNDCVMPCAGAEGFLVLSVGNAQALGLPFARILASSERHNAYAADPIVERGGWAKDRDALWARAGLAPGDVDCVQTYDDYPALSALQLLGLGLCDEAGLAAFLRETDFTLTGALPHNSGGGQLGCGQAGAAGGFLGLTEALRQLLGQPLGGQVRGARHAAVSGYGIVNFDRCLCTAAAVLAA